MLHPRKNEQGTKCLETEGWVLVKRQGRRIKARDSDNNERSDKSKEKVSRERLQDLREGREQCGDTITSEALQSIGVQLNKHLEQLEEAQKKVAELFIRRVIITDIMEKIASSELDQVTRHLAKLQEQVEEIGDVIQAVGSTRAEIEKNMCREKQLEQRKDHTDIGSHRRGVTLTQW